MLRDIVECAPRGTRYGIGVDPADGLLRAGEPGVQLTWMDAKVGDWVVTPRIGKPVEINALWYNALRTIAGFLADRGDDARARSRTARWPSRRARVFPRRFWRPELGYLADVVDGPDGDDLHLRPNQIFALSLPYPLLEGDASASVSSTPLAGRCSTRYGLRSLSPDDPAYRGDYGGDRVQRDGALPPGPGLELAARRRMPRRTTASTAIAPRRSDLLRPFGDHLRDAGLGSVSEILEGDAPHLPRGAVAQAWGVAEVLRVWRMLETAA